MRALVLFVSLLAASVAGQELEDTAWVIPGSGPLPLVDVYKVPPCQPGYCRPDNELIAECVPDPRYWEQTGPNEQVPCPDGRFGCLAIHWGRGWVRRPEMWTMTVVERCDTVPTWEEVEYSTCLGSDPLRFTTKTMLIQVGEVRCVPDTTWVVK